MFQFGGWQMRTVKQIAAFAIWLNLCGSSLSEDINQSLGSQNPPSEPSAATASISADDLRTMDEQILTVRKIEQLPEPFQNLPAIRYDASRYLQHVSGKFVLVEGISRQIRRRAFAILPCGGNAIVRMCLYDFDFHKLAANLVLIPSLNMKGSLQITESPGYLEWDPEHMILTSILSTDLIPSYEYRSSYKFTNERPTSVAMFRIERRIRGRPADPNPEWRKIWEAPEWGSVNQFPP